MSIRKSQFTTYGVSPPVVVLCSCTSKKSRAVYFEAESPAEGRYASKHSQAKWEENIKSINEADIPGTSCVAEHMFDTKKLYLAKSRERFISRLRVQRKVGMQEAQPSKVGGEYQKH